MKVKAVISFGGLISMSQDEERELPEGAILSDLLKAGLVKEIKKATPAKKSK